MCGPGTIAAIATGITAVASIGSGITTYIGQASAAAAQQQAQNRMAQARYQQMVQARQLAEQSQQQESAQLNIRRQQEEVATANQIQNNQIQARQARARARVSAGESGVSGLSIEALYNDFYTQQALNDDAALQNLQFRQQQLDVEQEGIRTRLTGQLNQLTPTVSQPIQGPSLLATGLNAVGDVSSAYNQYQNQRQFRDFYSKR